MDSIISKIMDLAEPSRPKTYRKYLTTLTGRDLQEKLADLQAEAGTLRKPGNWAHGRQCTAIKIS